MANKQNTIPFLKRTWVSSIGVFLLSQIIFIICEGTGWIPKYREIDGTFLERITESFLFREWFTFYETPQFNLITVFFAIVFFVLGIVGGIKNVLSPKDTKKLKTKKEKSLVLKK